MGSELISWKFFDGLSAVLTDIPLQFSPNIKYGVSVMGCGEFFVCFLFSVI